jgi:branched-chain amino acid transport system ATP-binding protein
MTELSLRNVSKRFGGLEAVSDLSLTIKSRSITGLIGPNGAGKSTIVNLITGMLKVSSGQIDLNGRDISRYMASEVAAAGVSRTFQNIRLLRDATVLDNIVIGYFLKQKTSMLANLLGLPSVWREKRDFVAGAIGLLRRFDMLKFRHHPAGKLSYGDQRRVEMMRALAMDPKILLLDEPIAGMNDVEAAELGEIFKEVASSGVGILLIEHNVPFVRSLCTSVTAITRGRLIANGSPDHVCSDPGVIEAYLGS